MNCPLCEKPFDGTEVIAQYRGLEYHDNCFIQIEDRVFETLMAERPDSLAAQFGQEDYARYGETIW